MKLLTLFGVITLVVLAAIIAIPVLILANLAPNVDLPTVAVFAIALVSLYLLPWLRDRHREDGYSDELKALQALWEREQAK